MKRLVILILLLLLAGCQMQEIPAVTESPAVITEAATEIPAEIPTEAPTLPTEPPAEPLTEPPTEAPTDPQKEEDLVRIRDFIPGIQEDLAYASEVNFTGKKIYDFYNAYLRYGTVQKLSAVCEELEPLGLGILIWDGFRPVSAQAALWEICPDPSYVSHPVTGTRAHCRGNAVDLTLYDLATGEPLPMPTTFDDFSTLADRDYSDCDPVAAENARLLESVMEKHGFKPYKAEWWHFTDTDSYSVEENFQPPVG